VPGIASAAVVGQKWAVVSATGTLARGNGVTAVSRLGAGVYSVQFTTDMSLCAYEAIGGDPGTGALVAPVVTSVALRSNPTQLLVKTFDESIGSVADAPFHVTTYCGPKLNDAVIAADGTTVRGAHVSASSRIAAGSYAIDFDHDVSKCAFTATGATTALPGPISVAGLFSDVNGVFVQTLSRAGVATDLPFQLAVDCGATKLVGVIKRGGAKARGAHLTASANLQTGVYEVIFDRDVSACAYTATVGVTTNGGSVDDPVAITAASRTGNVDGVAIAIRDVNGVARNEPFHLKVTC